MSESRITARIIEQIRNASSLEDIRTILAEVFPKTDEPRVSLNLDQAALVTGGTGRIPLNDELAGRIVGGGHYAQLPEGGRCWINLHDNEYALGTDRRRDAPYVLEELAMKGSYSMDILTTFACDLFAADTRDIAKGMKIGGPAFVANSLICG